MQVPPQPRSTHVTGTAFKRDQEHGLLSPAGMYAASLSLGEGNNHGQDYFNGSATNETGYAMLDGDGSQKQAASTHPPADLLTGDDEAMGDTTAQARNRSTDGGRTLEPPKDNAQAAQAPPSPGQTRPLLPQMNSARLRSNFESEQWSSLESMRRGSPAAVDEKEQRAMDHSSDDDAVPESATKGHHPQLEAQQSSHTTQRKWEASHEKTDERRSPTKSKSYPFAESGRQRPASVMPLSPDPRKNLPAQSSPARPGHTRKDSITDMVTRYESLHTDSASSSPIKSKSTVGPGRPNIAVKPPALRQMSAGGPKSPGLTSPVAEKSQFGMEQATSTSPTAIKSRPPKPSNKPDLAARKEATAPTAGSAIQGQREVKVKPATKPKPTSTGLSSTPAQPADIRQPTPLKPSDPASLTRMGKSATSPAAPLSPRAAQATSPTESGKSSPDKQQSVNSLIARWNKR